MDDRNFFQKLIEGGVGGAGLYARAQGAEQWAGCGELAGADFFQIPGGLLKTSQALRPQEFISEWKNPLIAFQGKPGRVFADPKRSPGF